MKTIATLVITVVYEAKKGTDQAEVEGEINSRLFNAAESLLHRDELIVEGLKAIECLPSLSILSID
jgi:hypothetical protein